MDSKLGWLRCVGVCVVSQESLLDLYCGKVSATRVACFVGLVLCDVHRTVEASSVCGVMLSAELFLVRMTASSALRPGLMAFWLQHFQCLRKCVCPIPFLQHHFDLRWFFRGHGSRACNSSTFLKRALVAQVFVQSLEVALALSPCGVEELDDLVTRSNDLLKRGLVCAAFVHLVNLCV